MRPCRFWQGVQLSDAVMGDNLIWVFIRITLPMEKRLGFGQGGMKKEADRSIVLEKED